VVAQPKQLELQVADQQVTTQLVEDLHPFLDPCLPCHDFTFDLLEEPYHPFQLAFASALKPFGFDHINLDTCDLLPPLEQAFDQHKLLTV
jgi:hypothetical protein